MTVDRRRVSPGPTSSCRGERDQKQAAPAYLEPFELRLNDSVITSSISSGPAKPLKPFVESEFKPELRGT